MMTTFQLIWFGLIGILFMGYTILDGFDLGVGCWYLFSKTNKERQTLLASIGPVWDGNEVWLLASGGALFAAFPQVYATTLSGFYLPFMLVLFAFIFRAVSLEFRNKEDSTHWRGFWDLSFSLGSFIPSIFLGLAVGNILRGLPLDMTYNFSGTVLDLLNPYALLVGILGLSMIGTHGALYIQLKTSGSLSQKARKWGHLAWTAYIILFIITTAFTLTTQSHLLHNFRLAPSLLLIPTCTFTLIFMIGIFSFFQKTQLAFVSSSLSIVGLWLLVGFSIFPNLVRSLSGSDWSLTIMNASSSELSLKITFILAAIGMPLVLVYTFWIYRTFSGKVKPDQIGY